MPTANHQPVRKPESLFHHETAVHHVRRQIERELSHGTLQLARQSDTLLQQHVQLRHARQKPILAVTALGSVAS